MARDELEQTMSEQSEELWCIHFLGPDTLIPQPDFVTACLYAQRMNTFLLKSNEEHRDNDFYPKCWCNVVPWSGSRKRHADEIAEHGGMPEDWC